MNKQSHVCVFDINTANSSSLFFGSRRLAIVLEQALDFETVKSSQGPLIVSNYDIENISLNHAVCCNDRRRQPQA